MACACHGLAPEPNRSSNDPLERWDGFLRQAAVARLAAGAVSAAARAPSRQRPFDPRSAVPICSAAVNRIQITVSSGGLVENPLIFAKMISKPPLVLLFKPLTLFEIEPGVLEVSFSS